MQAASPGFISELSLQGMTLSLFVRQIIDAFLSGQFYSTPPGESVATALPRPNGPSEVSFFLKRWYTMADFMFVSILIGLFSSSLPTEALSSQLPVVTHIW